MLRPAWVIGGVPNANKCIMHVWDSAVQCHLSYVSWNRLVPIKSYHDSIVRLVYSRSTTPSKPFHKPCHHAVFTALHICRAVFPIAKVSVRLSVCPSVCLSQRELWQNERKFRRNSYTTWKVIHICFRTHKMVGGGRPLLPEILGRRGRPGSFKNGDFHSIFARSGSTVGASEKSSIMTNRSSVRAFQWA